MFSLGRKQKNKKIKNDSLQVQMNITAQILKKIKRKLFCDERMSLCTSFFQKKSVEASITVEASVALPVFLFVVLSILYFIEAVRVQVVVQGAVAEVGREISREYYVYKEWKEFAGEKFNMDTAFEDNNLIEIVEKGISQGYLYSRILKQTEGKLPEYFVEGGNRGLILSPLSGISEDGWIELGVCYQFKFPIPLLHVKRFSFLCRERRRAWIGCTGDSDKESLEAEGKKEMEMVFVTLEGSVYHLTRECSYLNPSIQRIEYETLQIWRNESGGIYYPCERCKARNAGKKDSVYITDYGEKYHLDRNCSGLKRTVLEKTKEEALKEGKKGCQKCAS